jgi:hypothetical protein
LTGASALTVWYVPASFAVDSDTQITATVPVGACDGRWRVTNSHGEGGSGAVFTVSSGQQQQQQPPPQQSSGPPVVSSTSPSSGAVGSSVTLTGSGFTGASSLTVCYVPASFTVDSDTQITATVPVGACDGRWRVRTSAGEGMSGSVFTVSSGQQQQQQQQPSGPPVVSSSSLSAGAAGTSVTLGGSGFLGASAVTLCYIPAAFTVVSDSQITAIVPVYACDGRWRVTTPLGTGLSSTVFGYL